MAGGSPLLVAPFLVLGAWVANNRVCLGSAGLGVFADPTWITVRLMLQVEMINIGLILVAAVWAPVLKDRPDSTPTAEQNRPTGLRGSSSVAEPRADVAGRLQPGVVQWDR